MAELPIAVTMGEPAGISAEITARAWAARGQFDLPPFFVIGDP
ncbi:MAG TPA: 4-hydroxythreonine-4-phosphate dehydrogenase, partial [Alphaproteobacteria bacterium]|nr:4-hydroxythreonine-4-phosphate dehydrogenase [Alphaproteobacteria bacterium]HBF98959.1 4-hydroxythreonine-4-phosphate dehydrogenase [Alphaproteobacteria bacterium]